MTESWSEQVVRACLDRARARWGLGWEALGDELRRGAIAVEVVGVVLSDRAPTPAILRLQRLCDAALGLV